jgi:PAS domain S-box-containing protein
LDTLIELGLSGSQARVYLALLENGTSTVRDVSKCSETSRPDAYRAIIALEEIGLIERVITTPTKYKSLDLQQALAILIRRKEKEVSELHAKAENFYAQYKVLARSKAPENASHQFILIPEEALSHKLQKMVENSQENICVLLSQKRLLPWLLNDETIEKALERGITVKVLTEKASGLTVPKDVAELERKRTFQIRYTKIPLSVCFRICDGKEALLTTLNTSDAKEASSVWSNNSSFVELAKKYFDSAWFAATESPEQEFKRDRRQFDYLYANMKGGFSYNRIVFDANGNPINFIILEANDTFLAMMRLGRENLLKEATEIFPGIEKEPSLMNALYRLALGDVAKLEYNSKVKDRWFSFFAYSPEKGYFALITEDVTERRKAEELLRNSETKFRNLAEESPNMIFIRKKDRVIYANKKCEEIGYTRVDFYNQNFKFLNLAANQTSLDRLSSSYNRHLAGEDVPSFEFTLLTKEGKTIEVLFTSRLIKYDGDDALLGIVTDITELHNKESELRQERDKLEAVTKTTGVGLSMIGPDFQVLWINRTLKDRFANAESKKCYKAFHNRDKLCPDCGVIKVFADGEPSNTREICMEYANVIEWIEITAVPIRDNKGRVIAVLETGVPITERKKAEAALRESEGRFRAMADGSPIIMWIADTVGRTVFVNHTYQEFFGVSLAQVAVRNWSPLLHPDDASNYAKVYMQALFEKKPFVAQARVRSADGEWRWIDSHGEPRFTPIGEFLGHICIAIDITERMEKEKALRDSEERFKQVVENADEWIWEVDAQGLFTYASPIVEKIFGYTAEEIVGKKRFYDLFDPEDREQLKVAALEFFEQKKPFHGFINKNVHKNGHSVWISTSGVPIIDNGIFIGYRGADSNITRYKEIEQALQSSEAKYRDLINGMNDTVWVIDFNTKFLDANNTAIKLYGYSKEELLSMYVHDIDKKFSDQQVRKFHNDTLIECCNVFETVHTTKDGTNIPVEIRLSIITYQGKKAILSVVRDITERKKLSDNLSQKMELNQILLDSLPCVALLLRPSTREIVASNRKAIDVGAVPGTVCYSSWGKRNAPCPWCLAPNLWATGKSQHKEVEALGIVWDAYWIPVSSDLYMHYAFDITERKKAQEAVIQSETNYRNLFNNSIDAILLTKPDGVILAANPQACLLLGMTEEEIKVSGREGIVVKEKKLRVTLEARERFGHTRAIFTFKRKDGTTFPAEVTSSVFMDSEGAKTSMILRNITEHRKNEARAPNG